MAERPVVAVLGLGEIGTSLARGLRTTGRYSSVVGWDPSFDVARAAQKDAVADRFASHASDAVEAAALVFLALSGSDLQQALADSAVGLQAGAIVCSVVEVQETALTLMQRLLPQHVSVVCADPIPWATTSDDERSGTQVFQGGVWCIASAPSAHADAVGFVAQIGEELGMAPFFLDAREHDSFVTGVQILPSVLSASLVRTVTSQTSWREMSRLAGASFRTMTSPGLIDQSHQQELASAREHLIRWIDLVMVELTGLRAGLEDGREPSDFYESAWQARAKWLREREVPPQAREAHLVDTPRRRFPF